MAHTVKSTNEYAGIQAGYHSQWLHIDAGNIGRTTITPKTNKIVVLIKVLVNKSGSAGVITLTDTSVGIIGNIAESASPIHFPYNLPLVGNLTIDNPGGADLTFVFRNR